MSSPPGAGGLRHSDSSGSVDRGGLVVISAIVAVAASAVALDFSRPALAAASSTFWWPLLTPVLVAVQKFRVQVLTKRSEHGFDLTELPILVGAVLLPPRELLAATSLGFVAWFVMSRPPLVRCVFNVANQMVGVVVVQVVLSSLMAGHQPLSLAGCLAMATALAAAETVVAVNVMLVMTATGGFPGRVYLGLAGVQVLVLTPLNLTLGLAAIASYEAQPAALVAFAVPILLVGWWYSRWETMRASFSDLQLLYAYSESLAVVHDRADVLQVALTETQKVLHCDHAELCVASGDGLVRYRLADGHVVEEPIPEGDLESSVIDSQLPILVGPRSQSSYLGRRGVKDVMAVPLSIRGEPTGALVVTDRHGDAEKTFQRAEAAFVQALAAHLGTALTSSDFLEDLRRSAAQREHLALHDSLTGMPNRAQICEAIATSLEQSGAQRTAAVVLLDLDGFREVNEALGHRTGDSVLKMVGARIRSVVGAHGLAGRLGGDEFAFVITSAASIAAAVDLAEEVLAAVSEPTEIDAVAFNVRAAVGIAVAPIHGTDADSLLRNADVAMYAAKRSGRRVQVYEHSMDKSSARRLSLASGLADAIHRDELALWYQPVAEMVTGATSGFEALLRWEHPEFGPVPPDEFIPIAEQTGLIEPLTWWVLDQALGEMRKWRDRGFDFSVAVNISVRSVVDPRIVHRVRSLLDAHGLSPSSLILEITESAMMNDFDRCGDILSRLADMGVRIAIDDFGTGYSSLARLKSLPVQILKIDREFIRTICTDLNDQAIVKTIIDLAHVMGYTTVAEGIEDIATWNRLISLGCEVGQGYFFARPMPAGRCQEWVLERHSPHLAVVHALDARRVENS
jgi:diguanylate cyclase (GGDEF)-like protein